MSGIFLRIELGGVLDRKHKVGPLFWILKKLVSRNPSEGLA
jgi:hypothetical protein